PVPARTCGDGEIAGCSPCSHARRPRDGPQAVNLNFCHKQGKAPRPPQRQGGIMRYAGGVLLALAVTAIPCGAVVVGVAFAPAVSLALHGRALHGPRPLPASHRRGDRSSAPWNLRMSCPLEASTSQIHDRRKAVRDLICRFSVLSSLQHALVSAAWAEADYNTMRAAKKNYAPRLTKGD
ncbi:MAG: hypothetical protein ACPIOQ_82420, partial [Promethearchaeia archaeon]